MKVYDIVREFKKLLQVENLENVVEVLNGDVSAGASPKIASVHHIFIIDTSASLQLRDNCPFMPVLQQSHFNRLGAVIGACYAYLECRRAAFEKSEDDRVSLIGFSSTAQVLFEAQPLDPDKLLSRMQTLTAKGVACSFDPVSNHLSSVSYSASSDLGLVTWPRSKKSFLNVACHATPIVTLQIFVVL